MDPLSKSFNTYCALAAVKNEFEMRLCKMFDPDFAPEDAAGARACVLVALKRLPQPDRDKCARIYDELCEREDQSMLAYNKVAKTLTFTRIYGSSPDETASEILARANKLISETIA